MANGIQLNQQNALISGTPLRAPELAAYPSGVQKAATVTDTFQHEFSTSTFVVGSDVISLAGANKKRRYLLIQNIGAQPVFIDFGGTPRFGAVGVSRGILLAPNTNIVFENGIVPNNEVRAVCTPTTTVVVCEGIIV